MVLLHVDDDVLDLGQEVDALGPARIGAVAGLADRARVDRMDRVHRVPAVPGTPATACSPRARARRPHPDRAGTCDVRDPQPCARNATPARRFAHFARLPDDAVGAADTDAVDPAWASRHDP